MKNHPPTLEMHAANGRYWDRLAPRWRELRAGDDLWRVCPTQPGVAFEGGALELIQGLGDLHGRRAAVLGSGDNYAAFALAGLGARVTSIDISAEQLKEAAGRAAILGLEIDFVQADAAVLAAVPGDSFDLVCSTNGFFVWIAEPGRVFAQITRILRPGGSYVFYDIHPFQRPWKNQVAPIEMEKPYTETGPFLEEDDGQGSFEFNWRLSDLVNPLIEAGLQLHRLIESPSKGPRFWVGPSYGNGGDEHLMDWQHNPRAGLPVWLTVEARKPFGTR